MKMSHFYESDFLLCFSIIGMTVSKIRPATKAYARAVRRKSVHDVRNTINAAAGKDVSGAGPAVVD